MNETGRDEVLRKSTEPLRIRAEKFIPRLIPKEVREFRLLSKEGENLMVKRYLPNGREKGWIKSSGEYLFDDFSERVKDLEQQVRNRKVAPSEIKEKYHAIFEIAYDNKFNGVDLKELDIDEIFPLCIQNENLPSLQKMKLIDVYLRNPDLAKAIVENRIVGCHGTSASSILGILEHGIKPHNYLDEREVLITSGEHMYGGQGLNKVYSSFFLWYSIRIREYSGFGKKASEDTIKKEIRELVEEKKESNEGSIIFEGVNITVPRLEAILAFLEKKDKTDDEKITDYLIRENFSVVYLVKGNGISNENTVSHISDKQDEFAVENGRSIDQISIILVPKDRIGFMEELIEKKEKTLKIFPLEDFLNER